MENDLSNKLKKLGSYGMKHSDAVYEGMGEEYYNKVMSDLEQLDSIAELDEEQITKLKEKMKQIEVSLKDKIKPKTITVSGSMHNRIKKYCTDNEYNIGEWTEMVLNKEINNKPKRMEIVLLNELNKYREDLTKKHRFLLSDHNYDGSRVNKVNEVIYLLRDQLWKERDQMRTIKVDMHKHFKEYDTSNMKDSILRDYPGDKFVIQLNYQIAQKFHNKDIKIGDKTSICNNIEIGSESENTVGVVTVLDITNSDFYSSYRKNSPYSQDNTYWNTIVFSFNKNTFDFDTKIHNQISYLFGIELKNTDYFISPHYEENHVENLQKENTIFDLNSKLMFTDNDLICKKIKEFNSDIIADKCDYYGHPSFLKINDIKFIDKVNKELERYNIVDKYNLKDKDGKRKRIFINIRDVELSFELNDKYATNDYDVNVMGYRNIVEILGCSKVDDSIILAYFKMDGDKSTFDNTRSMASQLKCDDVEMLMQSSLRYHL
jgi:hypothetical protein